MFGFSGDLNIIGFMKLLFIILSLFSASSLKAEEREACLEEYLSIVEEGMKAPIRNEIFPVTSPTRNECEPVVLNPTLINLATDVLSATEGSAKAEAVRRANRIRQICEARQNPGQAPIVAPITIRKSSVFEVNADSVNYFLIRMYEHIDANPTSRVDITLSLDSGGGNIASARRFVQSLRRVGNNPLVTIRTEVRSGAMCDSACTIMFAGGEHRIAYSGTTFGFHKAKLESRNGHSHAVAEAALQERSVYWVDTVTSLVTDEGTRSRVKDAIENSADFEQIRASHLGGYVTMLR